jgi:sulfoxide reductase heme-binding subunit YedZ
MSTAPHPGDHLWWLMSRSAGLVALLLVTVSVGIGLMMAGRVMRRPGLASKLLAIHEQSALAGLVAIAVHGLTLLGDPFLRPGVAGIALPGVIDHRPVYVAVGILGGYLSALLGLTFYARRRIGPRLWRKAHRLTALVYGMAVVHTLGAGTDAGSAWLRGFMVVTGVPIVALFVRRVVPRPARTPARGATATADPGRG